MYFKNNVSGEILTLEEFVSFVWDEAERQFEDHEEELWCNLTREEQISVYCEQYEHQIQDMNWVELQEGKEKKSLGCLIEGAKEQTTQVVQDSKQRTEELGL